MSDEEKGRSLNFSLKANPEPREVAWTEVDKINMQR
jgi:ribosomal protein L24E